jgi:hypothetical protein
MHPHIPEADWKRLRQLKDVALDRFCARILQECREITAAADQSNHQRYLELYRHLQDRDAEVASAFNHVSRSTAVQRLAAMRALELITDEEFALFTAETRESVSALVEILYR